MNRRLTFVLILTIAVVASGQTSDEDQDAAEKLLRKVDSRIYYPVENGLQDVRFLWKIEGSGVFEGLAGMYMSYAWKAGKVRFEFTDEDGKALKKLPEITEQEQIKQLLETLKAQTHAMAQQLIIGATFEQIYRDYYKSVKELEVNNKIEYKITMTPKVKKLYSTVVLKIQDGLPRESVKTTEKGEVDIHRYRYDKRGEKYLYRGFKLERDNQLITEDEYEYVMKKDILILSSFVRGITWPQRQKNTFKLFKLQVNTDIPDAYFEVPEPAKGPAQR